MSEARWTPTELAYLAGIIDGEGSISIRHQTTSGSRFSCVCALHVGNTDFRLVTWLRDTFGGSVRARVQTTGQKDFYEWLASTSDLAPILTAVLPHLKLKRDRAELMLAYRQTVRGLGRPQRVRKAGGRDLTSGEIALRQQVRGDLALLNKRGA